MADQIRPLAAPGARVNLRVEDLSCDTRLTDVSFELHEGELRVYEGGYSYYAEESARRNQPPPIEVSKPVREPAAKTYASHKSTKAQQEVRKRR